MSYMSQNVLNMTGFDQNMTGFVLNMTVVVLNMTGFVLNMTGYFLNKTGCFLNKTGFDFCQPYGSITTRYPSLVLIFVKIIYV